MIETKASTVAPDAEIARRKKERLRQIYNEKLKEVVQIAFVLYWEDSSVQGKFITDFIQEDVEERSLNRRPTTLAKLYKKYNL